MKKTQKYLKATEILTVNHFTQQELYSELNRLGWWWNSKVKEWERNQELADPPMEGVKIRLWSNSENIEDYTEEITQLLRDNGYKIIDKSNPYQCRPPKHSESRIYLTVLHSNQGI